MKFVASSTTANKAVIGSAKRRTSRTTNPDMATENGAGVRRAENRLTPNRRKEAIWIRGNTGMLMMELNSPSTYQFPVSVQAVALPEGQIQFFRFCG